MDRRTLGRSGEWVALLWLLAKGYRPRHRNWRAAGGEIDIVVERRQEIIFVEVKSRSTELYGGAAGAVNTAKKKNLTRVSSAYLSSHDLWDRPCRFDIVTIERLTSFPFWRLRHYRDAFSLNRGRQM